MEKIKAWFKNSVTILWARLVAITGAFLAIAPSLTANPDIGNAVHAILKPQYLPWYVIAIGIITEVARRRTAGKQQ
jgi:hypothetical protein